MIDKLIKQDTKTVWIVLALLFVFCCTHISDDIVTLRKLEDALLIFRSTVRLSFSVLSVYLFVRLTKPTCEK